MICNVKYVVRNSFPSQPYKSSYPFLIIHSDIWGPNRTKNITGATWFFTFIDDHTRTTWTFLMKEKSEAGPIFRNFQIMVQIRLDSKIQVSRTDNGK